MKLQLTPQVGNSVDVRKFEREAKQIDEELKRLIKRSEKTEVNLDKIEEHSERRKKIRKAIDEAKNISLEQEKRKGYAAMIQNPKNNLKNKRELYNYLLKFGDIYDFRYDDNSKIDRKINTRKNILVSYVTEGGLQRAL